MYKYLALLPAVMSFVGFVLYLFLKNKNEASPVVVSIVETIRSKSADLPELDKRLEPKEVFKLINKHPELREKLSQNDYDLLLYSVKSEYQKNYLYGFITIILVGISIFAYYKIEQYQNRLSFSDLSVFGSHNSKQYDLPTTKDDIVVKWNYEGQDEEVVMSVTSIDNNKTKSDFKFRASDKKFTINNKILEDLWACPELGDTFQLRFTIQTAQDTYSFGPFVVSTALNVLYYLDSSANKLEVFSQTMNCGMYPADYELRTTVWGRDGARIESLNLNVEDGKAEGIYPADFIMNEATFKIFYVGKLPNSIVRFQEL